jgi:hypothetical protein
VRGFRNASVVADRFCATRVRENNARRSTRRNPFNPMWIVQLCSRAHASLAQASAHSRKLVGGVVEERGKTGPSQGTNGLTLITDEQTCAGRHATLASISADGRLADGRGKGEGVRGENAKMEVAKLPLWPYQRAIPEQMCR